MTASPVGGVVPARAFVELAPQRLHVSVLVPEQNLVTVNNKSPYQRTNGHDITHDVQKVVNLVVREDWTMVTTTATSRSSNASSCHPMADCRNNEGIKK